MSTDSGGNVGDKCGQCGAARRSFFICLNFVPQNQEAIARMLSDLIMDEIKEHQGQLRADPTPRLRELP